MAEQLFESRTDLSALAASVIKVREEIRKMVVGQEKMVDLLIAALLSNGHVLIEGVPGVAKTLTAKLISRTLAIGFSRIQFTPDLMPSDVLGTTIFNPRTSVFEFNKGPIFSNLILIDEINRSPAKTQAALFEVMEERQVTMDGTTYKMTQPFIVLATQNPIEQEGTYRLPEAQLDRFIFKIEVDYPKPEEEVKILSEYHARKSTNDLQNIEPVLSAEQIAAYQQTVRGLHIEPNLIAYIAQIVNATRKNPDIYLGASPRASIAIMTSAKAIAAMRGRDFVTPDDVQEVTYSVLRHRIMLTPEKEMEGADTEDVITQLIKKIEVPR